MYFSPLQKYIIKSCYPQLRGEQIDRQAFAGFYNKNSLVKKEIQSKIITKSLERLIDRGILVGYGIRTPKKWFIKKIRLTTLGKKQWEKYLKRNQRRLPL